MRVAGEHEKTNVGDGRRQGPPEEGHHEGDTVWKEGSGCTNTAGPGRGGRPARIENRGCLGTERKKKQRINPFISASFLPFPQTLG